MNRTRPLLLGSLFLAIIAPGCDLKPAAYAPATPQAEAEKEVTKADVFKAPAPREAGHDPRVAEAASAGDAVAQSLAVIHQRLQDLEKAYDAKARTEEDLAAVTERMKPLLAAPARTATPSSARPRTSARSCPTPRPGTRRPPPRTEFARRATATRT